MNSREDRLYLSGKGKKVKNKNHALIPMTICSWAHPYTDLLLSIERNTMHLVSYAPVSSLNYISQTDV